MARLVGLILAGMTFIAPASAEKATIAVAANFQNAAETLAANFEQQSGHELTIAAGSTGKLYAQIVNGAPFDVFLSADQERPRLLEERGIAVQGACFTYAIGRLALWSPPPVQAVAPETLAGGKFKRLAIANPALAPYGAAAKDVLLSLGLWEMLQPKIVMGENVSHSFTYVATGAAELGFVALPQILALPAASRGAYWAPPADLHAPLRQDAALLTRAAQNAAAIAFVDYLKSPQARATIEGYGYEADH